MASSASGAATPRPPKGPNGSPVASPSPNEAILRNALRYTISAREYASFHKYVLSRSKMLRKNAPSVDKVARIMNGPSALPPSQTPSRTNSSSDIGSPRKETHPDLTNHDTPRAIVGADDFNARAIRHALRVLFGSAAGLKILGTIKQRVLGGGAAPAKKEPLHKSATLRISLSLSSILLLYRLLFRFFTRLRTHLLDPAAMPFRLRNPRTAAALTSAYAPAAGASLAGLALGVAPAQFRMTIALMAICRALEFAWNAAEDSGAIWGVDMVPVALRSAVGVAKGAATAGVESIMSGSASNMVATTVGNTVAMVARPRPRPWWWGSWLLQPLALGQLLHAGVFDRDCFPEQFGSFLFGRTLPSDTYLHTAPLDIGAVASWPGPYQVLDAIAEMARANWPAFLPPALFPTKDAAQLLSLPVPPAAATSAAVAASAAAASAAVSAVTPLTSRAHPLIKSLACATLHPDDPSCGRTYLTFWLRSFPQYARFFLLAYTALQLPRASAVYHAPVQAMQNILARALRSATMLTGTLSTAWASICFFQRYLPHRMLATQRFFLGGFLSGLWAYLERKQGHAVFLYTARASLDSLWRVGAKRRWWRPASQGADVLVFAASLLILGTVYERDARAVRGPNVRKGLSWVRGEGFRDWSVEEEDDENAEPEED